MAKNYYDSLDDLGRKIISYKQKSNHKIDITELDLVYHI